MRRSTLLAAAIALMTACGGAQAGTGSVAFQGDAAHDGAIAFKKNFAPPLALKWVKQFGGPVSYPIVAHKMAFVTVGDFSTNNVSLVALSLKTGAVRWQKSYSTVENFANAAYDKGRLFVVTDLGQMQAVTADKAGQVLWDVQLPVQSDFSAAPTALQGQVYATGAGDGETTFSVNELTGAINWQKSLDFGSLNSSPALDGAGGLYLTYACNYFKLDATSGKQIWNQNRECTGGGGNTPVYYNEQVFVRDPSLGSVVLDALSGRILASLSATVAPAFWTGAGGERYEYTVVNEQIYCVDTASNNVVWSFPGDGKIASAPLVIDDYVAVGSNLGNLYLLDARKGKLLWSDNVGAPIVQHDNAGWPLSGLGGGDNVLLVPATNQLSAYAQQ